MHDTGELQDKLLRVNTETLALPANQGGLFFT